MGARRAPEWMRSHPTSTGGLASRKVLGRASRRFAPELLRGGGGRRWDGRSTGHRGLDQRTRGVSRQTKRVSCLGRGARLRGLSFVACRLLCARTASRGGRWSSVAAVDGGVDPRGREGPSMDVLGDWTSARLSARTFRFAPPATRSSAPKRRSMRTYYGTIPAYPRATSGPPGRPACARRSAYPWHMGSRGFSFWRESRAWERV